MTSCVDGGQERVYGNLNSSNWMERAERCIFEAFGLPPPIEDDSNIILPLVLSYDKTSLTNATGASSRSVTPLYVAVGTAENNIGAFPSNAIGCVRFFPGI